VVDYSNSEEDFSDAIEVRIDRKNVFEDAFNNFMGIDLEKFIHQSFSIKFNGEEGNDQGDYFLLILKFILFLKGGLSKEFLTCLSKEIFDENKGLFEASEKKDLFCPHPFSIFIPDYKNIFRFLGKMMGKV
jgi:hypothetical protein